MKCPISIIILRSYYYYYYYSISALIIIIIIIIIIIMSLKSMNTDEIKDPCYNKHENLCKSSPCHLIVYAFVCCG